MRVVMVALVGLAGCAPEPLPCQVDGVWEGNVEVLTCAGGSVNPDGPCAGEGVVPGQTLVFDFVNGDGKRKLIGEQDGIQALVKCTTITGAFYGGFNGFTDELVPNLRSVGAVGTFGDELPFIRGFDSLDELGGFAGNIVEIDGFNNITETGRVSAQIIRGFERLDRVGYLWASSLFGLQNVTQAGEVDLYSVMERQVGTPLPRLRDIQGRLATERLQMAQLSFGALEHVGGDVWISDSSSSEFDAFANGAAIDGSLYITYNQYFSTDAAKQAIADKNTVVGGDTVVCFNSEESPCPENFFWQSVSRSR